VIALTSIEGFSFTNVVRVKLKLLFEAEFSIAVLSRETVRPQKLKADYFLSLYFNGEWF
jgi:hypothetical protein